MRRAHIAAGHAGTASRSWARARRAGLSSACFAALLAPVVVLGSCAAPKGPPIPEVAPSINATLAARNAITLSPGDQIEVRFAYAPDWNQTLQVYPDGFTSFLGVDKLAVAGLLPEQLDEQLTAAYKDFLENPALTVVISQLSLRTITVAGEVNTPGAVNIPPSNRLTLVEALALAGGHLKETAYLGSTILVRWDAEAQRQLAWTIDARPDQWVFAEPIYLQEHDIVYVPNTPIDDIDIWVDQYMRRLLPFPYLIGLQ